MLRPVVILVRELRAEKGGFLANDNWIKNKEIHKSRDHGNGVPRRDQKPESHEHAPNVKGVSRMSVRAARGEAMRLLDVARSPDPDQFTERRERATPNQGVGGGFRKKKSEGARGVAGSNPDSRKTQTAPRSLDEAIRRDAASTTADGRIFLMMS